MLGTTPDEQKKIEKKPVQKPPWDEKLQSLKSQRRARGECFRCGDKYQPGHKCSKSVPLHMVEELIELLHINSSDSEDSKSSSSSSEETLMYISKCALAGTTHSKSIRLQGTLHGKQVLILIDSGSCGSFISDKTVIQLGLKTIDVEPVTVQVADSRKTQISTAVPDTPWECRGTQFNTTFRVFNIPCYDIILGMDWLNECGKMWIDWPKKTLRFKVQGKRVTLKGIKDTVKECSSISAAEIQQLIKQNAVAQVIHLCSIGESYDAVPLPHEIAQLLSEHEQCFGTPTGLPPHRAFDHRIELMRGVQPVNVKPYRYSPQQKDEIERQIKEMIHQGIIKPS
jgi:hypothetical protein